jgi:hypothetical protein
MRKADGDGRTPGIWLLGTVSCEIAGATFRTRISGSPEIRFSNFLSQDSLIFPGTGMDSNS